LIIDALHSVYCMHDQSIKDNISTIILL